MAVTKVGIVSLGCAKNLVDTEVMLGLLRQAGMEITAEASRAEVLVVNTCAFIREAREESVVTLREMARFKEEGCCRVLIATGCLSQRLGRSLLKKVPQLDAVVGTGDFPGILGAVALARQGTRPALLGRPVFLYDHTLPRVLSGPSHRAYIKIAEGCSHRCAFCVIPRLRGSYRSREPGSVLAEGAGLARQGVKEINLIAQDTTAYGRDRGQRVPGGEGGLPGLLRGLARVEGPRWLRVLYGYPTGITAELLEVLRSEAKVCSYLDVPLQHAHPEILKKMGRPFQVERLGEQLAAWREQVPGLVLRSTFITGFPGEKEKHFQALYDFVQGARLDRVGVFTYSRERGTRAASWPGQVPEKVKEERRSLLLGLQREISTGLNRGLVGRELEVLVEGEVPPGDLEAALGPGKTGGKGRYFYGRYYGQAPGVDGLVYLVCPPRRIPGPGDLVKAQITAAGPYDLEGVPVGGR